MKPKSNLENLNPRAVVDDESDDDHAEDGNPIPPIGLLGHHRISLNTGSISLDIITPSDHISFDAFASHALYLLSVLSNDDLKSLVSSNCLFQTVDFRKTEK